MDTHSARAYVWSFKTIPDASLWWIQQWMDAYGLRPAVPYIDSSLPAHISRLANLKRDRGEFRELALRSLPRELAYNRKIGQSVPLRSWFRGPLRQFLVERITDRSVLDGFLNPAEVDRILAEHLSGEQDHRWLLWKMLSLITWKQNFERLLQY
ncbi:MAG: asparagine synthase-related protein [Acidimicrobiales bacterium]